ncbi:hypothetical protein PanWU01x14_090080 [Parasponia andersonii]|uniref:Uncharacterized protein n=1 Tax=Parasponia andersonii TaxID=3476 RepID=A0A2P5D7M1_PARAD|nr:hypothetical protein PanWU01x14_090080 [Parasponia andersonii]
MICKTYTLVVNHLDKGESKMLVTFVGFSIKRVVIVNIVRVKITNYSTHEWGFVVDHEIFFGSPPFLLNPPIRFVLGSRTAPFEFGFDCFKTQVVTVGTESEERQTILTMVIDQNKYRPDSSGQATT